MFKPKLIRPSGQNFSFDIVLASEYGFAEALIIHHFQYWIRFNKRKKINFKDNRTWSYQTLEDITAHLSCLSQKKVRTALDHLVHQNVLLKNNYNKEKRDRTLWYAFAREDIYIPEIKEFIDNDDICPKRQIGDNACEQDFSEKEPSGDSLSDLPKKANAYVQKGRPLPDTKLPDKEPPTNPTLPKKGSVGGFIKIFECLENIAIKSKDKQRLCNQFSEKLVKKAVAYCTKPKFKPQKSLDASIFYFCKNPDHMSPDKEDLAKEKDSENQKQFELLTTRKYITEKIVNNINKQAPPDKRNPSWYYAANAQNEFVELISDREKIKIYYKEKDFRNKIQHYLIKLQLPTPKLISELP